MELIHRNITLQQIVRMCKLYSLTTVDVFYVMHDHLSVCICVNKYTFVGTYVCTYCTLHIYQLLIKHVTIIVFLTAGLPRDPLSPLVAGVFIIISMAVFYWVDRVKHTCCNVL